MKNPVTRPGIDPGTVRLVAQRLNHYATPGPLGTIMLKYKDNSSNNCEFMRCETEYLWWVQMLREEHVFIFSV
jgi:hypothetical protein